MRRRARRRQRATRYTSPRAAGMRSRPPREFAMRRTTIRAIAVFLFLGVLFTRPTTPAPNPPGKEKPFVQVPDTISAEARKYLESLPDPATLPVMPAADDVAGWK